MHCYCRQEDCHPIFMQEAGEQHQVVSGELAANGCPQKSIGSDTQVGAEMVHIVWNELPITFKSSEPVATYLP